MGTFFDAFLPLGGAYWIRSSDANCSTFCEDCFWIWAEHDQPPGAFLASVGYGPASGIPGLGMLLDDGNFTERKAKAYGGVRGLIMSAKSWKTDDIDDDGLEHFDWDKENHLVTTLDHEVSLNCTEGGSSCLGLMFKPYVTATVSILGASLEPIQEYSAQQAVWPNHSNRAAGF